MPNSIALAKKYVPVLDEIYKNASLTADLDGPNDLVREGANAGELIIPKMSLQGMADYDKDTGYDTGTVTLENETVQSNYDRGRMFNVDNVDNMETAGVAFGRLAGEFIRTKVVPELDAFRFAAYASATGIGTVTGAALTSGADVIAALRAGVNAEDEAEVPSDERYLYITPTLLGLVKDLETTKSREVLDGFAKIVKVPQTRFYTAITLTASGAGGFSKAAEAKDINFMIIHKPAVIQFQKHVAPKIITPEQNQNADAYKFGYRTVGIADVYDNKVSGIYLHKAAT